MTKLNTLRMAGVLCLAALGTLFLYIQVTSAASAPKRLSSYDPQVKALLANGGDVNAKVGSGFTALMEASQNGHQDIVQALLAAKGDVNAKNNNGNTALSYASIYGHQKTVELLKEAGAEQ